MSYERSFRANDSAWIRLFKIILHLINIALSTMYELIYLVILQRHSRFILKKSSINGPQRCLTILEICSLCVPYYSNNYCNTLQIHDQETVFLQWSRLNICTQVYCCTGLVLVRWRCFPWDSKLLVAISAGIIFAPTDKCRKHWLA